MSDIVQGRPEWTNYPLYKFLSEIFPAYKGRYHILDVLTIAKRLNISGEAIYRWLRKGKLTPKNAQALCTLANDPANVEELAACNPPKKVPVIEDFMPFVFSA